METSTAKRARDRRFARLGSTRTPSSHEASASAGKLYGSAARTAPSPRSATATTCLTPATQNSGRGFRDSPGDSDLGSLPALGLPASLDLRRQLRAINARVDCYGQSSDQTPAPGINNGGS